MEIGPSEKKLTSVRLKFDQPPRSPLSGHFADLVEAIEVLGSKSIPAP